MSSSSPELVHQPSPPARPSAPSMPVPSPPSVTTSAVFLDVPSGPLTELVWDLISPLIWKITVFYTKILIVLGSIGIFATTAVMLYSVIYWLVVPKQLHSFPAFFDYSLAESKNIACANVTLGFPQWSGFGRPVRVWDRPQSGFEYDISLNVYFPRNEYNKGLSPVMVTTSVVMDGGVEIGATKRPLLLVHASWIASVFRDIVWMAVSGLGLVNDSHVTDITLIESFPFLTDESVSQVNVCMSPPMHVYSANVNFVSKLSGLMYIVAHHPVLTGVAVVTIAVALSLLAILVVAVMRNYKPRTLVNINGVHATDHESDDSYSSGEEFIQQSPRSSRNSIRRRNRI